MIVCGPWAARKRRERVFLTSEEQERPDNCPAIFCHIQLTCEKPTASIYARIPVNMKNGGSGWSSVVQTASLRSGHFLRSQNCTNLCIFRKFQPFFISIQ